MESLRLDKQGIHEYQQNRAPYLLIDMVEAVVPGEFANGYKDLTDNDWFFECHFPGDPNMPGMLQIEALVQMCALTVLTLPGNKGKIVYLVSADNIKLQRKVVSGDRLDMKTTLLSWKRGIGKCTASGTVNGEATCRADFTIVMPNILEQFRLKRVKEA